MTKCCICGTVRNCGRYLDKVFQNIELIGSAFEDYVIIIYYDQSDDDTLQKLKDYRRNHTKLYYYVNTSPMLPYRTHRIAKGRNFCLNKIRKQFSDFNYFIMMDMDDKAHYNINLNLLQATLSRNDWDGISFQHPEGYYDSWALSKRPFVISCHHFKDAGKGQRYITNIINKTPKHKLIPCLSAFNGFAIYRRDKFINCRYDGTFRLDYFPSKCVHENLRYSGKINFTQNKEDCEHRSFHFESVFKNKARIRISPNCLYI
jgi:hypothetical protein